MGRWVGGWKEERDGERVSGWADGRGFGSNIASTDQRPINMGTRKHVARFLGFWGLLGDFSFFYTACVWRHRAKFRVRKRSKRR